MTGLVALVWPLIVFVFIGGPGNSRPAPLSDSPRRAQYQADHRARDSADSNLNRAFKSNGRETDHRNLGGP